MEQPEELARLRERFVGEWDFDLTMRMPDGNTVTGNGTATVREVSRGNGIQSDLSYTVGGRPYEETDLWSYDRIGEIMHMFGVGSDGSVHDHTGGWKDAGTLELHWRGIMEDGEAEETVTATCESAGTVRIRSEVTVRGAPGPVMDSVGRKRTG